MGEQSLDKVARARNVITIKQSSGDIDRLHLLAREHPYLKLACGKDDQAFELFAWGAMIWACSASNFFPLEHFALYRACVIESKFTKGHKILSALMPLLKTLIRAGKFVQCINYGVTCSGIEIDQMRSPLSALNKDNKRELEHRVRTLKTTNATTTAED